MRLFKARFDQAQGTPDTDLHPNPVRQYASCDCLRAQYRHEKWDELRVHDEAQDISSEAWHALEQYIAEVAASNRDELNPLAELGPEKWEQIVTLPPSIKNLKSVKFLELYGSHLVRIPPEIGEMISLEEFDPYTSNSLHWFPYEITHCRNLKRSRVSTRALLELQVPPAIPGPTCGSARCHSRRLQCLWQTIRRRVPESGVDFSASCDRCASTVSSCMLEGMRGGTSTSSFGVRAKAAYRRIAAETTIINGVNCFIKPSAACASAPHVVLSAI